MPSTAETFNALVGDLDYPMFIVTAAAGGERAGCLVGFATQCSIDPPRFLVCISEKNRTFQVAQRAEALGVHLLPADATDLEVPLLERCRNRFVGRVQSRLDAGDHVAFLLEPVAAERGHPVRPFPFHRARRFEPGHDA